MNGLLNKFDLYLNLIKHHFKNHTLMILILETLLLGINQTSWEIIELSVHFKLKKQLKNEYYKHLVEFDKKFKDNLISKHSNKIWICWFQGIENAPELVKCCYNSIISNFPDKEIILITHDNIYDFVDFPEFIKNKWDAGIISDTHMADLLRLELLIKYGGLWLDATVFCSSSKVPSYIFNSDLFVYQRFRITDQGHVLLFSNWLISAKSNNRILMATRHLLHLYWKEHNHLVDYFIFHLLMSIVADFYPEEWNDIVPVPFSSTHLLLERLFQEYDEKKWDAIKNLSCFHKLTYKTESNNFNKINTYYKKILDNY